MPANRTVNGSWSLVLPSTSIPCLSLCLDDRLLQMPDPGTRGGEVVTRTVRGGEPVATVGPVPQAVKRTKTDASAPLQAFGDITGGGILSISVAPPRRLTNAMCAVARASYDDAWPGHQPRTLATPRPRPAAPPAEGICARHRSHPGRRLDGPRTRDVSHAAPPLRGARRRRERIAALRRSDELDDALAGRPSRVRRSRGRRAVLGRGRQRGRRLLSRGHRRGGRAPAEGERRRDRDAGRQGHHADAPHGR